MCHKYLEICAALKAHMSFLLCLTIAYLNIVQLDHSVCFILLQSLLLLLSLRTTKGTMRNKNEHKSSEQMEALLHNLAMQAISPGVVATEIVPQAKKFDDPKASITEVYGKIDFVSECNCL